MQRAYFKTEKETNTTDRFYKKRMSDATGIFQKRRKHKHNGNISQRRMMPRRMNATLRDGQTQPEEWRNMSLAEDGGCSVEPGEADADADGDTTGWGCPSRIACRSKGGFRKTRKLSWSMSISMSSPRLPPPSSRKCSVNGASVSASKSLEEWKGRHGMEGMEGKEWDGRNGREGMGWKEGNLREEEREGRNGMEGMKGNEWKGRNGMEGMDGKEWKEGRKP
jgi:hypothetical protein